MILLDTVTFLWIITGNKKLSKKAEKLYIDNKNTVFLSSVSVWEIIVKYKLNRLSLSVNPKEYIPKQRFLHAIDPLPLEEEDFFELENLPDIHADPFDRMLICQAIARNLTILTPDKTIKSYPVKSAW